MSIHDLNRGGNVRELIFENGRNFINHLSAAHGA